MFARPIGFCRRGECPRVSWRPVWVAINNCCAIEQGSPYLEAKHVSASISFRWLHSFREFHGDEELPYPTDPSLYANTHVYGFDLSVTYQATDRFGLTFELPMQYGDRTSYYEHDFVHRFTTRANGVGDLRLIGNYWLFDPLRHREGNVNVGLGVKIPTGNDDVIDMFHQLGGLVVRPVDPAIQPGDGGWGIITQLAAFQKIYRDVFAYAQGVYLLNPRDSNGVQQPTGNEDFYTLGEFGYTFNSVPDQISRANGSGLYYLAEVRPGAQSWQSRGRRAS